MTINNNDKNQSPFVSTSTTSSMMMKQHVPEHISDPFSLHESLTVGLTTAILVTYLHFHLQEKISRENKELASSSALSKNSNNKKTRDPEFGARIISFLHAFISSIGSAYALYTHLVSNNNSDFTAAWFNTREATRLEANWQMFSLSYFFCDTMFMIFSTFDATFFVHHMIAMASLSCGSLFGIYGPIVASAQLAGEISNPFMHLRWLLNAEDRRDSWLCKFCTKMWYLTFFTSRILICPFLGIHAIRVMHPVFWPQVWLMIIFSGKFIYDSYKADKKGIWWIG